MTVSAPARSAATGCGCGCGGEATQLATAFVRPRFFAGQLLTEDDLQALTGYLTGKDRLRNRLLAGPGVVCGLEVVCDPCGNGKVTVRPGYALDRCGNDIVVNCAEQVDINALVHDLRVRSLGVDCGDPCGNGDAGHHGHARHAPPSGSREYGLYVRYTEVPTDLLAPYATDESCPPEGCTPSRIRETYRFLVKCVEDGKDHRYRPARQLDRRLGDRERLTAVRAGEQRLGRYRGPLLGAVGAAGTTVLFDDATAGRFTTSLHDLPALLVEIGADPPVPEPARRATELVRALASALARYDLYDAAGQEELSGRYGLDVAAARSTLDTALSKLDGTDNESVWPDPVRRSMARAVLAETRVRVVEQGGGDAPLERRLLAQGAPLDYDLRAELFRDLAGLRRWLLVRLDQDRQLADCEIRGTVGTVTLPTALPATPPPGREQAAATELELAARAAGGLGSALLRYLTDVACASILPPCGQPADADVLLARIELADCVVSRICAARREQWLPGGPGYAAWLPVLDRARELAGQVCCQPLPVPDDQDGAPTEEPGPVALPYLPGLLLDEPEPEPSKLDELLALLESTRVVDCEQAAPVLVAGATAHAAGGRALPAGAAAPDSPATTATLRQELAQLRERMAGLAELVQVLQTQAGGSLDEPEPEPEPGAEPEPEEPAGGRPAAVPRKAAPRAAPQKAAPQKAAPQKAAPHKGNRPGRGQRPGSEER